MKDVPVTHSHSTIKSVKSHSNPEMIFKLLISFFVCLTIIKADNVGWKSYFEENPTEFHDILLEWEGGELTSIPDWLYGIFVRNGPAQVS